MLGHHSAALLTKTVISILCCHNEGGHWQTYRSFLGEETFELFKPYMIIFISLAGEETSSDLNPLQRFFLLIEPLKLKICQRESSVGERSQIK